MLANQNAENLLYLSLEHCKEFLFRSPNFAVLLTQDPVTDCIALTLFVCLISLNIPPELTLGHGTSLP